MSGMLVQQAGSKSLAHTDIVVTVATWTQSGVTYGGFTATAAQQSGGSSHGSIAPTTFQSEAVYAVSSSDGGGGSLDFQFELFDPPVSFDHILLVEDSISLPFSTAAQTDNSTSTRYYWTAIGLTAWTSGSKTARIYY